MEHKRTFLSGFGMKMIKKVDTRYFYSSFLDGATTTNIQEAFMSGIKELDKNNFLQISSDGSNVNLKFLELTAEELRSFHFLPTLELVDCIRSITV